jgi:hypothetical protein
MCLTDASFLAGGRSDAALDEMLSYLPEDARAILSGKTQVSSPTFFGDPSHCLGMSTAEARQVDAALRSSEFERDPVLDGWQLAYWLQDPRLNVLFEPILPDGTITCSGCG